MINVKIFTGLAHQLSQEHMQSNINKWLSEYFEDLNTKEYIVKILQSQSDGTITVSIWYYDKWGN